MDLITLFEMDSLSCLSAWRKLGICSSVIITSSEEGFKVPPLIIEKWMNARMFWLAFSTMLYICLVIRRLTTSLAVSNLTKALKLTVNWSYTCCGRGDSGEACFKSAA